MADAHTWMDGDPQPGRDIDTVVDVDGDTWERWMADHDEYPDLWAIPEEPEMATDWEQLLKNFGPLVDATYQPRPIVTVHLPAEDVT